jgi:hypothetical protein
MNLMKRQITLVAGITLVIAAGHTSSPAAVLFHDDFDDLSKWTAGQHGAVATGVDTETGSRTVFGHDGTLSSVPASEIQVNFPAVSMTDPMLQTFTFDTVLRVNSALNNIVIEVRNEGAEPGDFHRLYTAINGPNQLEFREYAVTDSLVQGDDGPPPTPFPFSVPNLDSHYFTFRIEYDFATTTWTVSSDHTGSMTAIRSFTRLTTVGEFDRIRLRLVGVDGQAFSLSRYFVDSVLVCTDGDCVVVVPPELGVAITTGVVNDVTGFMFDSDNGTNYQLECSTNDVDWTAANVLIHGLGQTETTFDPNGYDSNKTYRIVIKP